VSPAAAPTPYLDDLPEFMHGHRKKTLFLIERLRRYAAERGLDRGEIRVLELGCGNGRVVTLPIAEQGFEVVGVDSHLPSIESARADNRLPNARFEHGDFSAAPGGGDFHAVVLSDVLEHVDDPGSMLEVAAGALRPDGILLVSIPNGYGPYEVEQFLVRIKVLWLPLALVRRLVGLGVRVKHALRGAPPAPPEQPAYNVDSPHVQHFRLAHFRELVHKHGFRVVDRRNGTWFGGDLTYFLFYFVPTLVPATLRLADSLPPQLVSTWYFECRRGKSAAE
jgi:SAM-dependent methyltransferase